MLTHGSLFSGIGGFDLASEWMGWENVFHCEYDPFCQKVLKHHFPNSKLYKDVRTFDATDYAGRIDLLSGGFPCQPFSSAGKRKGTEDERHLWPEMLRIIREVSPRYVVGENVRGLLNWSGGLVFEEVCADLENEGYEVTPYLLPACGKNAPHRRDRIWFVANSTKRNDGRNTRSVPSKEEEERICERNEIPKSIKSSKVFRDAPDTNIGGLEGTTKERRDGFNVEWEGEFGSTPDTDNNGHKTNGGKVKEKNGISKINRSQVGSRMSDRAYLSRTAPDTNVKLSERRDDNREDGRSEQTERTKSFSKPRGWEEFPTQPPLCGRDDGVSRELDSITFPKWRKESIKAYGNAIVPAVVFEIFKAIQKMEDLKNQEEEV